MTDELIGGTIRQAIAELEKNHGTLDAYPATCKLLMALEALKEIAKNKLHPSRF